MLILTLNILFCTFFAHRLLYYLSYLVCAMFTDVIVYLITLVYISIVPSYYSNIILMYPAISQTIAVHMSHLVICIPAQADFLENLLFMIVYMVRIDKLVTFIVLMKNEPFLIKTFFHTVLFISHLKVLHKVLRYWNDSSASRPFYHT